MKIAKQWNGKPGIKGKLLLATVYLAASGWVVAQAQTSATVQPDKASQPAAVQPSATAVEPDRPMLMVNKGSKLVGAKVRDPQGDVLGKIDDIIVDFDSGRVSYCALKVKDSSFSKGKYLAIPLGALHPSVDGLYLILDTDKDKIAAAKGFDKNDWPSINNPAWGAQPFWQENKAGANSQDQFIPSNTGPDLNPNRTAPPTTSPQPGQDRDQTPTDKKT